MRPLPRDTIADRIERVDALDSVAEPLQGAARRLVPQETAAKDLLSGTWLGHPLHPLLTDVVVGTWTSAAVLDLLGGEGAEHAADDLIGVGILAAVPTALSGLADWAELRGGPRRVGLVHALGNTTALVLHIASWRARRGGRREAGRGLSAAGMLLAGCSAWLGGHLSFGRGVGVNQTAFESPPQDWTAVGDEAEVGDGALVRVVADETGILLVRSDGELHAMLDRCSHRGCSLAKGSLDDGVVTCPCHGSQFALDGTVVRGPATAPQPALEARVEGGKIEVRRPAA
jgi:nitrite reductase/ring-hydroxylating ferredoxin subunit/uncharacterized membrane protein